MFAFTLWGNFGVFRDPLTITQNMSLSIPPKTTIGGILAAIMGIDYNDYFSDIEYFNFKYSIVLKNPVRKKSFSQNYVDDYTKKAEIKYNVIESLLTAEENWIELNKQFDLHTYRSSKDYKQIDKKLSKFYNDI